MNAVADSGFSRGLVSEMAYLLPQRVGSLIDRRRTAAMPTGKTVRWVPIMFLRGYLGLEKSSPFLLVTHEPFSQREQFRCFPECQEPDL